MTLLTARVSFIISALALLIAGENRVSAQTVANIQDITWALGASYPTAIKGGAAGIVDNTLVYAGGEAVPDNSTHDSNLTYGIPLGGSTWTNLPNLPKSVSWLNGRSVGNTLYAVGGRSNFQSVGTTYSLSQTNGVWSWSQLASLNTPRGFFTMGDTDGKLFVEGGFQWETSTFLNAPEIFDTTNPQAGWQNVAPFPSVARELPTVAGVNGNFYVFGGTAPPGYMGGDSTRLTDAYEYHTATNQWTALPALPYGISGASSVVYGDRYIIMLGGVGQIEPSQPGYYNNRVDVYDTVRGTYTILPTLMPYGTGEMGVAIAGNTIYAVGGETSSGIFNSSAFQIGQIMLSLQADANHDGVVNGLDINLMSSHWLASGVSVPGDVNSDGVVNGLDIDLVASQWLQSTNGGGGTAIAAPEPNAFALLGMGLACIAWSLRPRWHVREHEAGGRQNPRA